MTGKHQGAGSFLADLAERAGSVFAYSLITLFVTYQWADLKHLGMDELWPVLCLPTLLSILKGLIAGRLNPDSGASLLPTPPGPDLPGN